MQNFVYLIGSTETRKVAVVDAAWEIDEILRIAAQDDMEITHALVTHTHPDHVGGRFAGVEIEGVVELLSKCKARVVVHKAEAEFLKALSSSDLIKAELRDLTGDSLERRVATSLAPALGVRADAVAMTNDDQPFSWRRVPIADGIELHVRDDSPAARDEAVVAMREAVRAALGREELR